MKDRTRLLLSVLFLTHAGAGAAIAQTIADDERPGEVDGVAVGPPRPPSTADSGSEPVDSEIEEVVVIGDRTLRSLREELIRAEDYVHELFNALNDDDEYDIHCYMETRTGTRISQRVCKANYVDAADAVEARANIAWLRGEPGSARAPAIATIQYKNGILRQKLTELVNRNAELREAVESFAELSGNYEAAKQQILDSR